jgi:hypothetical protein
LKNLTTYQRALAQARKLQPAVRQINNSLMFDVASTSQLDAFHHVYLGPNKFNVLLDCKCDCGGSNRYKACVHVAAAFLQYTSNLEARLFAGGNYIAQLEDNTGDKTLLDEANDLFTDLLDRYERCCDLLKAIEAGWDISNLREAFKTLLPTKEGDQLLLSA